MVDNNRLGKDISNTDNEQSISINNAQSILKNCQKWKTTYKNVDEESEERFYRKENPFGPWIKILVWIIPFKVTRHHAILIRQAKIFKGHNISSWQGCGERVLSKFAGGNMNYDIYFRKQSGGIYWNSCKYIL